MDLDYETIIENKDRMDACDIYSAMTSSCSEKLCTAFYEKISEYPFPNDFIYWENTDFFSASFPTCGFEDSGEYYARANIMQETGSLSLFLQALNRAGIETSIFSFYDDSESLIGLDDTEKEEMKLSLFNDIFEENVESFLDSNSSSGEVSAHVLQQMYEQLLPYSYCLDDDANSSDVLLLASKDLAKFMQYKVSHPTDPIVISVTTALEYILEIGTLDSSFYINTDDCFYICLVFASADCLSYSGLFGQSSGINPLTFLAAKLIEDGLEKLKKIP